MSRNIFRLFYQLHSNKVNYYNALPQWSQFLLTTLPNKSYLQYLTTSAVCENRNIEVSKPGQPIFNQSIDEVLLALDNISTSKSEIIVILKSLRMQTLFKGINSEVFKNDSRFKYLCDVFENSCQSLSPSMLVSGLRSLLEVGLPSTATCITTAEETILEHLDDFSIFNLIRCLYFHHKFNETDLQKRVVSELVRKIQDRLYEVSNPAEIFMLIHVSHLFNKENANFLENKIVESIRLMSISEIYKLLCCMGEKFYRNVTVLNAIAYHLKKRSERMSLKETIDVLYVFKKLNFFDPTLFFHLLNPVESEILTIKQPSLISGILTICGQSKFRHAGILDVCGKWIKQNLEICSTRELVAYSLTTANLNYCNQQTKDTLEILLPQLTSENLIEPEVILDVTWSLGFHDCAPQSLLLSVLSPKFYKPLVDISNNQAVKNKLKLLNLKGVLKMKFPECIFSCDFYLEPTRLPESSVIQNSRHHVLSVLSNFVPKQRCLFTNQFTDTGVFIDAEFIMDKALKPLALQEYGLLTKPSTNLKELPKECRRIALLVKFEKDFTNLGLLTGINALGVRLLKDAGYTVAVVCYKRFSDNKTEVKKTKYLLEKIKSSVLNL